MVGLKTVKYAKKSHPKWGTQKKKFLDSENGSKTADYDQLLDWVVL